MRWWGWGEDRDAIHLPPHAVDMLREQLGIDGSRRRHVPLEEVSLPEPAEVRLPGEVRTDREARVLHAVGRGYPDLVRIRSGDGSSAPDAVAYPASHDEVAELLRACVEQNVAVVPFGGGTSVVGGVEPLRDGHSAVVTFDLSRLDKLISVDRVSLLATFAPGLTGPRAEALLASRGLTLGHYPQSFEYATVGGFVATRSAGQASTGYGRIDELVRGVRLAAPAGDLAVKTVPASAAGPSLRELVVGSEGALGVITEATFMVRPLPRVRRYEGWSFRSFAEGCEAFRTLEHEDSSPDVARLSDEEETRLNMALASSGSLADRAGRAYLRARGHEGGCIVIVGYEGSERDVALKRGFASAILKRSGGLPLGTSPGRSWLRNRYAAPYLRDELLDLGVMVETLETATTWSNLLNLHRAVREALHAHAPLVMCHVSHLYRSGASLYFTFLGRQDPGREIDQWRAAKAAASDAIVANGGTITHHHAIGRDHLPWMPAEVGEPGLELLRAAKERLDPAGIMNPGKLIP
ncbi:MAG TPA: FAD-binding oxidoreductase [Thermoleophilaceae bacterium]